MLSYLLNINNYNYYIHKNNIRSIYCIDFCDLLDNYRLNNGNFDYCDYDEKVIAKNDYSLIGNYELHEKRQLLNTLQLIIQNIRNQKEKIETLLMKYTSKLNKYLKIGVTKEYFTPFRIGQKVKIVNLPNYFEMYNQEGFIIPIDYNIMSYQTRYYPYKKKYSVYTNGKNILVDELNIIPDKLYNIH